MCGGSVNTADPTGLVFLEYIKGKAQWSIYSRKWTASWRLKKWLKNMRRTLTMFISEQDKPWCYAVGTQLCVVAFRGQIPAFVPHAAFTDKQSQMLACGRHSRIAKISMLVVHICRTRDALFSQQHGVSLTWNTTRLAVCLCGKCVTAVYAWGDGGEVSYDWHCSAMLHSSVRTVHKPDQG